MSCRLFTISRFVVCRKINVPIVRVCQNVIPTPPPSSPPTPTPQERISHSLRTPDFNPFSGYRSRLVASHILVVPRSITIDLAHTSSRWMRKLCLYCVKRQITVGFDLWQFVLMLGFFFFFLKHFVTTHSLLLAHILFMLTCIVSPSSSLLLPHPVPMMTRIHNLRLANWIGSGSCWGVCFLS